MPLVSSPKHTAGRTGPWIPSNATPSERPCNHHQSAVSRREPGTPRRQGSVEQALGQRNQPGVAPHSSAWTRIPSVGRRASIAVREMSEARVRPNLVDEFESRRARLAKHHANRDRDRARVAHQRLQQSRGNSVTGQSRQTAWVHRRRLGRRSSETAVTDVKQACTRQHTQLPTRKIRVHAGNRTDLGVARGAGVAREVRALDRVRHLVAVTCTATNSVSHLISSDARAERRQGSRHRRNPKQLSSVKQRQQVQLQA